MKPSLLYWRDRKSLRQFGHSVDNPGSLLSSAEAAKIKLSALNEDTQVNEAIYIIGDVVLDLAGLTRGVDRDVLMQALHERVESEMKTAERPGRVIKALHNLRTTMNKLNHKL